MAKKVVKPIKAKDIKVKPVTNRGVKAGTKRGEYKKKNKINDNNDQVNVSNDNFANSKPFNDNVNSINSIDIETPVINTNIETPQETIETPIETKPIENTFTQNEVGEGAFNAFINENKTNDEFKEEEFKEVENKIQQTPQQEKQFKVLINGYMLLAFIDFIVPLFLIKVGGYLYPDFKKLKAKAIRLTQEQKEGLREIADHMAQFIFAKMNPVNAFIIMLLISYGENAMNALSELKQNEIDQSNSAKIID